MYMYVSYFLSYEHYFLSFGHNLVFCDMPIILFVVSIIHSVKLSIYCHIGIISSLIAIIPSDIFINSCALL